MTRHLPSETAPRLLIAVVDAGDIDVIEKLRSVLPPGALRLATCSQVEGRGTPPPNLGDVVLTERQRAVLPLLLLKMSNKEIGRRLSISHFTVRNHVSQLLRILGAADRRSAIAMLSPPDKAEAA